MIDRIARMPMLHFVWVAAAVLIMVHLLNAYLANSDGGDLAPYLLMAWVITVKIWLERRAAARQ